jgi:hypothetical protein
MYPTLSWCASTPRWRGIGEQCARGGEGMKARGRWGVDLVQWEKQGASLGRRADDHDLLLSASRGQHSLTRGGGRLIRNYSGSRRVRKNAGDSVGLRLSTLQSRVARKNISARIREEHTNRRKECDDAHRREEHPAHQHRGWTLWSREPYACQVSRCAVDSRTPRASTDRSGEDHS